MTRKRLRFLAPLFATGLVVTTAACQADEDGGDTSGSGEFPRNETLYTTGTEWGTYSNYNPTQGGGQATGVRGLIYETLYVFDPHTAELEPWLAESGDWIDDEVYELTLREGIQWHDGEALTADDVVFTTDLRFNEAVPFSTMADWLETAEAVDDLTVRFTFSDPRRGEWDNFLYSEQIIPEHTWGEVAEEDLMTVAGDDIIYGTGPYTYHSNTEDRLVLERNDDWWGTEHLGLEMAPRFIVDFVNQGNDVVLPQLIQGEIDLSNNFILGINQINEFGDDVTTFYDEPPYMLSANTAYLIPNTEREPMNDPEFRRALAYSVDVDTIVGTIYQDIVAPADPTGLLPTWTEQGMVDQSVVSEHGFSYDPAQAEQILADAGYEDTNGDGFVESPDGEEIELELIVPAGWTDWNEAADVIAESAQAIGVNVYTNFPDSAEVDEARTTGDFDLVVNNWTDLDNTPWATYNYLFRLPVQDAQESANFARWENEEAWQLTQDLGRLSVGDPGFDELLSQLQEIQLTEMPAIPMWYNGLWSQVNNSTWTNWPTDDPDTPDYYPSAWNNFWEKKAVYMLAEIQPAG
ncbi:ABC transporter substrate-binding protein [Natronosporangium hydrolyticum]|uniref:ABC transporter substrate-binding protein n=1 Tax=Natronosporangium hydrolyticum TaxID=2811111 RepID=A0A895Y8E9_9ACTN|nr:ABC transporter substrate-binding protein [Natronosporangium hydrolyticum]QSB13621.1 ABC transporter substrate-binding protein [Natronosporangium hydrolyticum]